MASIVAELLLKNHPSSHTLIAWASYMTAWFVTRTVLTVSLISKKTSTSYQPPPYSPVRQYISSTLQSPFSNFLFLPFFSLACFFLISLHIIYCSSRTVSQYYCAQETLLTSHLDDYTIIPSLSILYHPLTFWDLLDIRRNPFFIK